MEVQAPKQVLVVRQVNPIFIHKIWPDVEPMLRAGLEHSQREYDVSHLKQYIVNGQHILLVAEDGEKIWGASTIVFENYPNERVAFMSCIGGKFIATQNCWDQLCDWIKVNGGSRIRGYAHPAVARLWRQRFGVETTYYIVDKKLE
jgi:hypothetical protein